MADLSNLNFDAREVEPNSGFEPIPAGKYNVIITESEMVKTKAGDGEFLKIALQIQGGDYNGRMLWDRLNLYNKNEEAVAIARQSLSAICRAVGVITPKDSADLHNKTLVAKVKLKARKDTGEPTNEIGGYLPYEPQARPVTANANGGPSGSAPPWKR